MEQNKTNVQISNWNKIVHTPFKKLIAFDLIWLGIGVIIGIGVGVYLIAGV